MKVVKWGAALVVFLMLLMTLITSCKSHHSGAPLPVVPVIAAEVDSFSTGSVPSGFAPSGLNSAAFVAIRDDNTGATIDYADVVVNGQTLTYGQSNKDYQGYLNVAPSDAINLTVTINGTTYQASGTQFMSYPVITSPAPGATWSAGNSHILSWSGGAPQPGSGGSYGLAILDASDPNGDLVWPSDNYLQDVGLGVTSNIIPSNGLSLGNRLAMAGISREVIVTNNSSYYIALYINGFTYSPFTVIPSPTPTNVKATPGNGQASVSWTPVDGATSYNLYWSTTAVNADKASGTPISNVSSPALHTGLTNGIPYYYVVTAVTDSGESAESTPVARTIPGTSLRGGAVQGYPLNPLNAVTTLAGSTMTHGYADCAGSAARFDQAGGITTDGTNIYVADSSNHLIRQIVITTGEVTTVAGKAGLTGSDDGIGPAARFNGPYGITTDGANLYIADTGNQTIRKIVISTGQVTTLAGAAGLSGSSDGAGPAARFNTPEAITTDGTNLYVADTWNQTIRKVVIAAGQVTTLAGSAELRGATDGTGAAARFNAPRGITTDGTVLYVADTDSYTIRKIVISTGEVTTLAGKADVFSESTDGTGTDATFADPTGITTDGTNLYVTDVNPSYGWHTPVRKIEISTGKTTTLPIANFYIAPGIVSDGTRLFVTDFNAVASIQ